jgi:hypothetical protein
MGAGGRIGEPGDGILGRRTLTRSHAASAQGVQLLPADERRRSQRVIISFPVNLHFTPAKPGKPAVAQTVAVNDHGAMLQCERSFAMDTKFELENARTRQRVGCRVTRAPRHSPGGFLIPVEFAQISPGFWGISFPPTDWKPFNE